MEQWKTIEGFENYEVSTMGKVRSKDRLITDSLGRTYYKKGCLLKLFIQIGKKDNYPQVMVGLSIQGKSYRLLVHRLVAKAFILNPHNYQEINHIDEDSTNNNVENLEWCNHKYNVNYGTYLQRRSTTKSKPVNIYDYNHNYIETLPSGKIAAEKYNISRGMVSISCHKNKLVKGLYFEFK